MGADGGAVGDFVDGLEGMMQSRAAADLSGVEWNKYAGGSAPNTQGGTRLDVPHIVGTVVHGGPPDPQRDALEEAIDRMLMRRLRILQAAEAQAAASNEGQGTGYGVMPSLPESIGDIALRDPLPHTLFSESVQSFQETNDQKVTAGTFNKFSEIINSLSNGRYGDAWQYLAYIPSSEAQSVAYQRQNPPPTAAQLRVQTDLGLAAGGPVFTGLASGARLFGAPDEVVNNIGVAQAGLIGAFAPAILGRGSLIIEPVPSAVQIRQIDNTAGLLTWKSQPLLTLSRQPGTVVRNALSDSEFAQAQELATFRGGRFEGAPTGNFPGIDGWLDGVPIQLKTVTGTGQQAILRNIVKGAGNMSAQGYVGDIAIDATRTGATIDSFANFVKPNTPVGRILSEGSVNNVYIKLGDGWLNITQGTLVPTLAHEKEQGTIAGKADRDLNPAVSHISHVNHHVRLPSAMLSTFQWF